MCSGHLQLDCISRKHRLLEAASLGSDKLRPQRLQSNSRYCPLMQQDQEDVHGLARQDTWMFVAAAHQVALDNQS
jgi:hypothetical protein